MRRKIALVLALVMILSLIPMSSFAASENRVTRVLQLQEDDYTADATYLVIRNNKDDFLALEEFSLMLENAEWNSNTVPARVYTVAGDTSKPYANLTRIDKFRLDVELVNGQLLGATGEPTEIQIPINVQVKGGDAKVTVDPVDSALTGGTYTFATTTSGDTVTSVASTVTFGPDLAAKLGDIVIDEVVGNVLGSTTGTQELKISLPRDFEWANAPSGSDARTVVLSRGFTGEAAVTANIVNDRDLVITLPMGWGQLNDTRGTMVIKNAYIFSDSDRFGDVNITTGGELTKQTLKVATYSDFAVTVEADGDLPEILAGRFDNVANEEGYELATLVFKEKIADSIVGNRSVTVEFPEWVKITSIEEVKEEVGFINGFEGKSKFDFIPGGTTGLDQSGKVELEFEIYVTVEDGAEGDIVAELSGRGLDTDYEVVLGKAIAPVSDEMDLSEIVIGESSQMLADIVITENVEGAIMEDVLEVVFDIPGLRIQSGVEVEVDEDSGLEIDEFEVDNSGDVPMIKITIDRESDEEPAVITISNVRVSMNRIPATGDYDVLVGGDAVVDNDLGEGATSSDPDWFEEEYVAELPMLRVVTERSAAEVEVAFTVGMELEPGVAPYISNDRLMVPVRFLEDVFGTQPIWNATSRTVTVLYDGMVYEMAIGSNVLRVNGAPYMELDANVEITNDRTFVPASRFARAMGIEYSWDPATQTATFSR